MKLFKQSMRLLIASFSLFFGFFGGWVLFAHANKPAPAAQPSPAISTPVPLSLPSIAAQNNTMPNLLPLPTLPPSSFRTSPRLRTRSS